MVAERHDQMADYMQRVGAQPVELSVEGRNMLSVADKNAVGSRRAVWRVITSVEQLENVSCNEQPATHATEYVAKAGTGLRGIRDGTFAPMDTNPDPAVNAGELKMIPVAEDLARDQEGVRDEVPGHARGNYRVA